MTDETKPAAQDKPALPNVEKIFGQSAATKPVENCGSCYFQRGIIAGNGQLAMECRRETPKVFMIGGQRGISWAGAWPPTKGELWCGEWSPKKA